MKSLKAKFRKSDVSTWGGTHALEGPGGQKQPPLLLLRCRAGQPQPVSPAQLRWLSGMASSRFLAVCVYSVPKGHFKSLGAGPRKERNGLHILRKEISNNLGISKVPQIRFVEEAGLRRWLKNYI